MHRIILLFALAFTMPASATDEPRCGTDAFGNAVCMDKNGVVTTAPAKSGDAKGNDKSAGSTGESVTKAGREDTNGQTRCGIDPFGNRVCR
jgi:hypothetical protein